MSGLWAVERKHVDRRWPFLSAHDRTEKPPHPPRKCTCFWQHWRQPIEITNGLHGACSLAALCTVICSLCFPPSLPPAPCILPSLFWTSRTRRTSLCPATSLWLPNGWDDRTRSIIKRRSPTQRDKLSFASKLTFSSNFAQREFFRRTIFPIKIR